MSWVRHQPPVYSPLPAAALIAAAHADGAAARATLQGLLREKYSAREALLFGSGTQALQRALELAAAEADGARAVALPAYTCPEVASAAIGAGLRIALYDVDPGTLGPEPTSVERVLAAGVRLLVAAPLYGLPIDWDWLETLARRHGALLVEDAAQGHGASWRGKPLGSLGDRSIISFGRGKGWTGGAGGALLLRGEATAGAQPVEAGGSPGTLARAAAQALLGRPGLYGLPQALPFLGLGETHFRAPESPVAIPAAAAALVVAGRRASEVEAEARRANAAELLAGLRGRAAQGTMRVLPGGVAGYLRLPLRLPAGLASLSNGHRAVRLGLAASYPRTLAQWPQVQSHLVQSGLETPGASELARTLITLPAHSLLSPRERAAILELLAQG